MKSISKYLLFIIATLSFCACGGGEEHDPTPGPGPSPSNDYVTVTKEATIEPTGATNENPVTISVTANGDWNASVNVSWLSINPSNGSKSTNKISLTAGENKSGKEREATITVTCGSQSDICKVTQRAIDNVSVHPDNLNFEAVGSTQTFTLSANVNWSVKEKPSWCKLSAESGVKNDKDVEIEVTAEDNKTEEPRSEKIVISDNNNNTATVSVSQKAGSRPSISAFQRVGESAKFTFEYNSIFRVSEVGICYSIDKENPEITDNPIKKEVNQESGSAEFTISNPPDKTYKVRAYAKNDVGVGYSEPITVKIEAEVFNVTPNEIVFDPDGEVKKFDIESNVSWTIEAPDWCILSDTSGKGNGSVTVEAKRNDTKKTQSGQIVVISRSGTKRFILVSQEPAKLKPGEDDNTPPKTVRKK